MIRQTRLLAAAALGGCMLPALRGSQTVTTICVSCSGDARIEVAIGTEDSSPAGLPAPVGAALGGLSTPSTPPAPAGEDASPAGEGTETAADAAPDDSVGVDLDALKDTLRVAEGLELEAYPDTEGTRHIGYGRQLTPAKAEAWLHEDALEAIAAARRVVGEPTWSALTEPRRRALAECAFANGATGLARYADLLGALRAHDYAAAALTDSVWAQEAPQRVARLAELIRSS